MEILAPCIGLEENQSSRGSNTSPIGTGRSLTGKRNRDLNITFWCRIAVRMKTDCKYAGRSSPDACQLTSVARFYPCRYSIYREEELPHKGSR